MDFKVYNFGDKWDIYKPLFTLVIVPYIIMNVFIFPNWIIDNALIGISLILIIFFYACAVLKFFHKIIGIVEIRNNEIKFYKPFSTRWAPIGQYRYIADSSDPKKIMVHGPNCNKLGKIILKSKNPEEIEEFLAKIEP